MWKGIVNQFVDLAGLKAHVNGLQFTGWRPSFVVVHNTSAPSLANYAEWRAHPEKHGNWTPQQWGRNLESYYRNQSPPWSGGPHAFVCPDGVLLFTPLTVPGTHSPKWNPITWGVETVGEFENEPFTDGVRDNLIGTLAILHARVGLNPADYHFGVRGIHFHKEDPITTHKTCPGRNMVKEQLVADVVAYMQNAHPGDHVEVPVTVHTIDNSALSNEELTSIKWLQAGLNKLGYLLPAHPGQNVVDGDAGPMTRSAVRVFETKMGLVIDAGIAGPQVRKALKAELSKLV